MPVLRMAHHLDRFMADHQWSHNDWYHRWILRQLPPRMSRALDVGCGTGNLVRLLADRADHVDGIDTDRSALDVARRTPSTSDRTTFSEVSVLNLSASQQYDAITAVAVLHHVRLADALPKLLDALVPGGTLLIVGCYREHGAVDRALSLAAIPANIAVALYRSRGRATAPPLSMRAPTAPPAETLSAIHTVARDLLPGYSLRRGIFWRYLLRYTAPSTMTPRHQRRAVET